MRNYSIIKVTLFLFCFGINAKAQTWNDVAGGLTNPSLGPTNVYGLLTDTVNNFLYACGDFNHAGGVAGYNGVARWNGVKWDSLKSGPSYRPIVAIGMYNSELFAADNYVHKWNGTNWSFVGSHNGITHGGVQEFATYNGKLFSAGTFDSINKMSAKNIASWDGVNWDTVGAGTNGQISALCVYNGELYAGGYFTIIGLDTVNYVAKWNGTAWSKVGSGLTSAVNALCVYQGCLYASGMPLVSGVRVAKWNGSVWTPSGTPSFPDQPVQVLQVYDGKLFALGMFGNPCCRIAEWNGTAWSPLADPGVVGGQFYALSVYSNEIYVGGFDFHSAGSCPTYLNNIARYYEAPAGIQEHSGSDNFTISPNPSSGIFNISVIGDLQSFQVDAFDILGKCIYSENHPSSKGFILDLSAHSPGIYFIRMQSGKEVFSKKVVIQ